MQRSQHAALVILLTAIGILLRLYRLDFESLWYDEVCSYDFARMPLRDILPGKNGMDTPPLYILLLKGWLRIVPNTDWWIRLLSALLGCLSLWPAYAFGKRVIRKRSAQLTFYILYSLSGVLIYFSQEARMYALLINFVLIANLLALGMMRTGRLHFALGLSFITGTILYTHSAAVAYVASIYLILLIWAIHQKEGMKRRGIALGISVLGAAICAIPAAIFLHNQTRGIAWLETANQGKNLAFLAFSAFSRFVVEPGAPIPRGLFACLSTMLLLWALLGLMGPWLRRRRGSLPDVPIYRNLASLCLVGCTALLPCILLLGISLRRPLFLDRYILYCAPSLLATVAVGMAWMPLPRIRGFHARHIIVATVALLLLANNFMLAHTRRKNDCRKASAELLSLFKTGDAVAFFPGHDARWFRYYAKRDDIPVIAFPPQTGPAFQKALSLLDNLDSRYRTLWFFYSFPASAGEWQALPRHLERTHPRRAARQYGTNLFLVAYDLQSRKMLPPEKQPERIHPPQRIEK